MKYYVIHYPKRPERKENLRVQFVERGISPDDVTWIEGFNKDDHFCKWVKVKTKSPMPLGQIASAVKQYWIMRDIVDRGLDEAVIFEDDVVLDPEFDNLDTSTFPRDVGLLRLGAGIHVLESSFRVNVKPDAVQTIAINNPGGCEAFWVSKKFADEYSSQANFDYSIDMAQHGFLMSKGKPLMLRYVAHQTSIGEGGDSTTGQCTGDWRKYVETFGTLTKYDFQSLVDEYRRTMMMMYPQKGHGLANTLMHLCDFYSLGGLTTSVVHDSIGDYELGRWLEFKFPTTSMTGIKSVYTPKIFINPHTIGTVFPLVRTLIAPSNELKDILEEHVGLVRGVTAGLHIRRGASASDSRIVVEADTETFASDKAVAQFKSIADNFGPVFLASDSPETKKSVYARTLDTTIAVVHANCPDAPTKDRRNVFVDFFLLSMCPRVFVTGGNFPAHPGMSTFGLMAAIYGAVQWEMISN
jgi:hypothetical protein